MKIRNLLRRTGYAVVSLSLITVTFGCTSKTKEIEDGSRYKWKEGFLDIHHINSGRGNSSLFIFPDGTSLLYDAGALLSTRKESPDWKEHIADIHPNSSRTNGAWIAYYIKSVLPERSVQKIDYAILSHFHIDHFGQIDTKKSPYADHKGYQLGGVTEVGYLIPISKVIDRGCPNYDYPIDLRKFYDSVKPEPTFENYLKYLSYESTHRGLVCEKALAGSVDQVTPIHKPSKYPSFEFRFTKVNQKYWSGKGNQTFDYEFPEPLYNKELETFNENPLSVGFKVSYGRFDYAAGGDIAGIYGFPNFDMETPLADVLGQVEVMTLNHHGANDSSNAHYLKTLSPRVIVHQALHGHHYYKPVIDRIKNLTSSMVFTMNADDRVREEIGNLYDEVFLNEEGHIVIRVSPGGESFMVLILDDNSEKMTVLDRFGPFTNYQEY